MANRTAFESELAAACRESMADTQAVVMSQQDWLTVARGLLQRLQEDTRGPALLVGGPGGTQKVDLRGTEVVLGRSEDCTVCLPYRFVSRRHCQLRLVDEQWVLEDLDSANGTLVNGIPCDGKPLLAGDILQVGEATILFLPSERGAPQGSPG
jgi:pSer/pThr/pTyr-binding forkhead associated (FHA) protein